MFIALLRGSENALKNSMQFVCVYMYSIYMHLCVYLCRPMCLFTPLANVIICLKTPPTLAPFE